MTGEDEVGERVRRFRARYDLEQTEVEALFGLSSDGRACRRWEAAGPPEYVLTLIDYIDVAGLEPAVRRLYARGVMIPRLVERFPPDKLDLVPGADPERAGRKIPSAD